ncbi:MAG: hypothetical protein GY810_24835 [Aureispira sp.]|nr:hypothetical protein [Aureispira sp.]
MQKILLVLLSSSLFMVACTSTTTENNDHLVDSFPSVEYSKVVAYHYDGSSGQNNNIIENGKLHPKILKEQELSEAKVQSFLEIVNDRNTYQGTYTRCFRPHLGIVFYDKDNKPKAHMSICFECNVHVSTPEDKMWHELSQEGLHGYSFEGRRKLVQFCKSLDFGHCNTEEESDTH